MKAIQVTRFNKPYKINLVEVPSAGPHELLVKIAVASHCHTDHMVQAGIFGAPLPITASHEGSGTVVAVGAGVTAFKPGDRVMCGVMYKPCGTCGDCIGPDESVRQYCIRSKGGIGITADGCFAEYARVDAKTSTLIPDEMSFLTAAPLACAGRTAWRAVQQADLRPGQWLAIIGSGGGLGHLAIQFAKAASGLRVIGIDARDQGLKLSKAHGAEIIIDARRGNSAAVKSVLRTTGARGADAAIVLSDASEATALACAVTRMHGTVVQVAQPTTVVVPFHELIIRDIKLKGSMLASPNESKAMLEAATKHGIRVKTNVFEGLETIDELMKLIDGGNVQGKGVIVVDPEQIKTERRLQAQF